MDRNLRIRMLLEAADRTTRPLRDIAGGARATSAELRTTRERLKEIDRAQADLAGFRAAKLGLRETGAAMQQAQARATALGRAMAETSTPTRAMQRDFARARQEADRLAAQHQRETQQLAQLRDRLRDAGIATNDLARHERELRASAERTNRELAEQTRRLERVTDRERRMAAARDRFSQGQATASNLAGAGMGMIGAGVASAAPFAAGVKVAQDFQSRMTDIAQKANLSRADAEKMGRALLVAGRAANQLPETMQGGVDTLSGFGLDPRQATQMMQPIGRAATAYKAEITDLAAASFAAHDNLKVAIGDTGRMIDVMAQAGKAGAFEMRDMAAYFPTLTAAYQGLGQTGVAAGGDLAAALQITRKGAGDSATAATNLANVLQKISSPATVKAFGKMGVDLPAALKRMYKEGKTPIEAIAELTNKTLKGDLSRLGYLFEDAQVQQGLRPLIQNMEEYRRIREQALSASGTTDTDFAERMRDSAEQTRQLQVNAAALGVQLGSILLPTVNAIVGKAAQYATMVGNVAQRHPRLAKTVLLVASGISALLLVAGSLTLAYAALYGPMAMLGAISAATGVAMAPLIGIAAGVVLGIVALAAAAYLIYKNWGAIGAWFAGLWARLKATFSSGIAGIGAAIIGWTPLGLFLGAFAPVLSWLGVTLPARFTGFGRNLVQGLIRGVMSMLGALRNTIVGAASAASNWFAQKLGIRSPSRVFMGLGGFVMEGLDRGLAAGADAPVRRLDSLSQQLTGAIRVGTGASALAIGGIGMAGAAPAAPAAASGPITITINPAPGQSPQDIAQAVAAELDRRERARSARAASAFTDRDYE